MLQYNAPPAGKSSIDGANSNQMNTFHWLKKAIITARKEQYFTQLASVENMPKHFGKQIKVYEYIPLLDDRNVNSQGLGPNGAVLANGNLYGSSKDIGAVTSKLPVLSENGGRVNRVGFTRIERSGSLHKFGFFTEFTNESLVFDSDDGLKDHLSRELINGANQLTEACLQVDLLNAAASVIYAGAATSNGTVTAEPTGGAPISLVSYRNLLRLDQLLTDNRADKHTKVITGSRYTDTKVISAARIAYIGSELTITLKSMKDLHNNPAFVEVQHYADAGNTVMGEIGAIGSLRFVEVPEMLHWAGVGGDVTTNPGYHSTPVSGGGEKYDVFPILVIGNDSFATIGFQTDGKAFKFDILTKMPGKETADRNDPYGETGFSSIKWYYGFLAKRPERIGLIKTLAQM